MRVEGSPTFFCNSRNRVADVDVVEAGTMVGPEEDEKMTPNNIQNQNPGPVGTGTTTVPGGDAEPPIDVGSAFRAAYDKRLLEITVVPDAEFVRLGPCIRRSRPSGCSCAGRNGRNREGLLARHATGPHGARPPAR